jgi:hypothetical protein
MRLAIAFAILLLVAAILMAPASAIASPGGPDRDKHPYVGMMVVDEKREGQVTPYCHITLISSTEAVIANHCALRGEEITFTVDNPVIAPATLHTGTVRFGGFDFDDPAVDVAIVDLHTPVALPRYAQLPSGLMSYGLGDILDYVTYVGVNRATNRLQNEPAHVDFDRNLQRTTTIQGKGKNGIANISPKWLVTMNVTCFGNSGSPIFPKGTDILSGVLSWGGFRCLGGGDSVFARTDNELALGILTGTVTPPPTCEEACDTEAQQIFNDCLASGEDPAVCEEAAFLDFLPQCLEQCGPPPPPPPTCEDACGAEAQVTFDDCIASGEDPAVCNWLAIDHVLQCLDEQCGQVTCENACFTEAVQIFNDCLASGEDPAVCDVLATDHGLKCVEQCALCESACFSEWQQIYEDCVASGQDPVACDWPTSGQLVECLEGCGGLSCGGACVAEALQIFNDCLASGEDLVVCDALADDNYEQCLTSCQ